MVNYSGGVTAQDVFRLIIVRDAVLFSIFMDLVLISAIKFDFSNDILLSVVAFICCSIMFFVLGYILSALFNLICGLVVDRSFD